jgi:hypothetical protein
MTFRAKVARFLARHAEISEMHRIEREIEYQAWLRRCRVGQEARWQADLAKYEEYRQNHEGERR